MKTFAYASLGVLALAVAFHLGASTAATTVVDNSESGIVAAELSYDKVWALDENGVDWEVQISSGWTEDPYGATPLPVPLSEVKFCGHLTLVTYDDHAWIFRDDQWVDCGQWPGTPDATRDRSWGRIRSDDR